MYQSGPSINLDTEVPLIIVNRDIAMMDYEKNCFIKVRQNYKIIFYSIKNNFFKRLYRYYKSKFKYSYPSAPWRNLEFEDFNVIGKRRIGDNFIIENN
jgi:hypothetical protein